MKEKTYYQQYDISYINQEAQAVLEGETGYAYCLPQLGNIQNKVGKPTEVYYGYFDINGEPILKEKQEGEPKYYVIKLTDKEIKLLAYKKERLAWFEKNLNKKVNTILKKKLMLQPTITSVNRVWNEIYDLLTA